MGDNGSGTAHNSSRIKASTKASKRRMSMPEASKTYKYASGGSVTIPATRRAEANSKNERKKFAKELSSARKLAQHGYRVDFTAKGAGNHDIYLNGIPAELKKVNSYKQIVYHATKAVTRQGAQKVVFDFQKETREIHGELNKISTKGIHGLAIFRKQGKIHRY